MKTSIAHRLIRLNRAFYDQFAPDFAASRSALQPGLLRALALLGERRSLVDLGCGDGRVGRALAAGLVANRVERYLGVDSSSGLLAQALPAGEAWPSGFGLLEVDMAAPRWSSGLIGGDGRFTAAVCLAALFHIPGARRRLRLLREMRALLAPDGLAVVSVWRFLHVPRLARKIVPWAEVGLQSAEVDRGDYLLDWRRGGRGLRYVHHFAPGELVASCRRAGFAVVDSYESDGATGDMSHFVVLTPRESPVARPDKG